MFYRLLNGIVCLLDFLCYLTADNLKFLIKFSLKEGREDKGISLFFGPYVCYLTYEKDEKEPEFIKIVHASCSAWVE